MITDIKREVLRGACAIRIFCTCGKALDVQDAVLICRDKHGAVMCARCWDVHAARLAKDNGLTIPELEKLLWANNNTMIDGREL